MGHDVVCVHGAVGRHHVPEQPLQRLSPKEVQFMPSTMLIMTP